MEEIIALISNVGFPIAIASYVIVVLNKTIKENNDILAKIVEKIDVLVGQDK